MQATKLLTLSSFRTFYLESTIKHQTQPHKAIIQKLREEEDSPEDFRKLQLANQGLEDEDVIPLLEALKKNKTVQELDLSHNNIMNASYFSEVLLVNKTLRKLNLSNNPLSTQTALLLLTTVLSDDSALEVLDLSEKTVNSANNSGRRIYCIPQEKKNVRALKTQQMVEEYSFSDSLDSPVSSITTTDSPSLTGEPAFTQEDRLPLENLLRDSTKENTDILKFLHNPFFPRTEESAEVCESPSFPSQNLSAFLQNDECLTRKDVSAIQKRKLKNSKSIAIVTAETTPTLKNDFRDIKSSSRYFKMRIRGNSLSDDNLKGLKNISQRLESCRNYYKRSFADDISQYRLIGQVSDRRTTGSNQVKAPVLQKKKTEESEFLELVTKINTFFNENFKMLHVADYKLIEQINQYKIITDCHKQEKIFGLRFENISFANLREEGIFSLLKVLLRRSVQALTITSSLLNQDSLCQFIGENIKVLNLSNNNLQELKCLVKCRKLEFVNLSYNKLTSVKGFIMCPNLQEIILKYNKIDCVKSLMKCSNLRLLDLSYNNLETQASISTLSQNQNLEILHLQGNLLTRQEGYETEIRMYLHKLKILNPVAIDEYSDYKVYGECAFTTHQER